MSQRRVLPGEEQPLSTSCTKCYDITSGSNKVSYQAEYSAHLDLQPEQPLYALYRDTALPSDRLHYSVEMSHYPVTMFHSNCDELMIWVNKESQVSCS